MKEYFTLSRSLGLGPYYQMQISVISRYSSGEVLSVCRYTVGVFYSPSRLNFVSLFNGISIKTIPSDQSTIGISVNILYNFSTCLNTY